MAFDKNHFMIWSEPQTVGEQAGGVPCEAGCPPNETRYISPNAHSHRPDEVFRWNFPETANIKQIVLCNWEFGDNSGLTDSFATIRLKETRTGIDKVIIDYTWTFATRITDRGTVWDVNKTLSAGSEMEFQYKAEQGANQVNLQTSAAIIGQWLD